MLKDIGFIICKKTKKQLLDTGLDSLKTVSRKVVYEEDEFLENKIAGAVTKSKDDNIEKQEPAEEIVIPSEKRDEILDKLRKLL